MKPGKLLRTSKRAKAEPTTETPRPSPARTAEAKEERLRAILDAAHEVFVEKGYAATRLEDVAARAGVAKGTVYLYVPSKEALFEALIRSSIALPIANAQREVLARDLSAEATLRFLFAFIRREVLGTRRKEVARLILGEAARFPELAEAYHRQVVGRGMEFLRAVAERAVERGEFRSDALVRFPQLAMAPALVAIVWTNLFQAFDPLDAEGMLDTHLELLMRGLKGEPS